MSHVILLLIAVLTSSAFAQTTWNFGIVNNISSSTAPSNLHFCQDILAFGAYTKPSISVNQVFSNYSIAHIESLGDYGTDMYPYKPGELVPVLYDSGMYAYYKGKGAYLTVGTISTSLGITPLYNVSVNQEMYFLVLDPDYPLLYFTASSFVGLFNISDPNNVTVLAQFSVKEVFRSDSIDSITPFSNYIFFTNYAGGAGNTYAPGFLRWNIGDLSSYVIDIVERKVTTWALGSKVDPQGRFIAVNYRSNGLRLYEVNSPYRLLGSFPYTASSGTFHIFGDYVIILGYTPQVYKISNSSTPNSYFQPLEATAQSAFLNASQAPGAPDYSSRTSYYHNGVFYLTDSYQNELMLFNSSNTAGLDLGQIAQNFPSARSCLKANGKPYPALFYNSKQNLILSLPDSLIITTNQMQVTDGVKNLFWNKIRYQVTNISEPNVNFQYLNNATGLWSNVTSFYQTDIDSGNIRLLPPYNFSQSCIAGNSPPAIVGNISFTASDIWTRTLPLNTIPFAHVCCSIGASVANTSSVTLISANTITAAVSYCTVASRGYYYDTVLSKILPCPLGTFNPKIGSVGLRQSCYSCPSGATTAFVASISWNDCTCDFCQLKGSDVLTIAPNITAAIYAFRPRPLVPNPHLDRPLFFTTAVQSEGMAKIGFNYNSSYNGTWSGNSIYEFAFGDIDNMRNGLYNVSNSHSYYQSAYGSLQLDSKTQIWAYYWKGFMALGYFPIDFDPRMDFSLKDKLLANFLYQQTSNLDPAFFYSPWTQTYTQSSLPIRDIGFGTFSYFSTPANFSNSYNFALDDYIDACNFTQRIFSTNISTTFVHIMDGLPESLSVSLVPPYSVFIYNWFIFGNVTATWIDLGSNSYKVSPNSAGYGTDYVLVLKEENTEASSNWILTDTFTERQLNNSQVFIKFLKPQSQFSQSFTVQFLPCHLWMRFCIETPFSITFSLSTTPVNGALDISSWSLLSGNGTDATLVDPGTTGAFSSTANPGRRYSSQVAYGVNSIYVYGGSIDGSTFTCDLWVYNISLSQWAKLGGNASSSVGTHGAINTTSVLYWPPSTGSGSMVYDSSINSLWLYGGTGNMGSSIWKFDISMNSWGWFGGHFAPSGCASAVSSSAGDPCPVSNYGELLVADSGSVYSSMGFLTSANNLQNAMWQFFSSNNSFALLNTDAGLGISFSTIDSRNYGSARQSQYQTNSHLAGSSFVYQVAGQNTTSGSAGNAVWIFDTSLNKFKIISYDSYLATRPNFRYESNLPIYPRIKAVSAPDSFGNIWIYGGVTGVSGFMLNDLIIFNTVAQTYQWVSGSSAQQQIDFHVTLSAGSSSSGYAPFFSNKPPSVSTPGALAVVSDSLEPRSLSVYLFYPGGTSAENVGSQVWMINAYIPISSPNVTFGGSFSFDVLITPKIYMNTSFFTIVDYDTPAHKIFISLSNSSYGHFEAAVNGSVLSFITYEMVLSGLQAYFVPSVFAGASSYTVSIIATDEGNRSATGSFNLNFTCQNNFVDALTCGCVAGYYSNVSFGCLKCPADYFKTSASNVSCSSCPAGSTTEGTIGGTSSFNCTARPSFILVDALANTFGCPAGTSPNANFDLCVSCALNQFKSDTSLNDCSSCASGTSTLNKEASSRCYNSSLYTVSGSNVYCNSGYYSNETECVSCPFDTYKSEAGNISCTLCKSGETTNNKTAATSSSDCVSKSYSTAETQSSSSSVVLTACLATVGGIFCISLIAVLFVFLKKKRRETKRLSLNQKSNTSSVFGHSNTVLLGPKQHSQLPSHLNPTLVRSMIGTSTVSTLGSPLKSRSCLPSTVTMYGRTSLYVSFPAFLLIDSMDAFRTTKRIGEGGFADLYIGDLFETGVVPSVVLEQDPEVCRNKVAIKIFKSSEECGVSQEQQLLNLENEATIMYALMPLAHVAKLLAVSKTPQKALVMKLYGENFDTIIHSSKSKFRPQILAASGASWVKTISLFASDLIESVAGMHTLEVCHLDLKPANFLIEHLHDANNKFPYRLVVTDFGLARFSKDIRAVKADSGPITAGLSLRYVPPEAFNIVRLLQNECCLSSSIFKSIDSYSVAVSIWEMLSEKYPFENTPSSELEALICQGGRPDLNLLPQSGNASEKHIIEVMRCIIIAGLKSNTLSRMNVTEMRHQLEQVKNDLSLGF